MKRKFIFLLTMCIFGLTGLLKAQDNVVTIGGDATSSSSIYPISYAYSYALSQHIYQSSQINKAPGVIESIAFKRYSENAHVRNITVYMKNTDKTSLNAYESFSESDKVFQNSSLNTMPGEGKWLTLTLDNSFEYTGGNILVIVMDNTGNMNGGDSGCYYTNGASGSTFYGTSSSPVSETVFPNGWASQRQPSIRFTFAVEDDLEPAVPANLTATAVNHNSISLTWNVAENAKKYNIYQGGEKIGSTSETSFTVEGLDAETPYSFTVTAVRGSKESDHSNVAAATTLEAPETRTIVFTLSDSYGDGWNSGAYLQVDATDGTNEQLDMSGGSVKTYELTIFVGAEVYVTYMKMSNSWPEENSYCINYKDEQTEIHCSETMDNTAARSYSFTVEGTKPSVDVNTENIAFETPIRGGSYWTERAGVQPIEVAITPKGGAEVTNIELVNNSFFSIPADIDLTANPITFNVSTGVSNEEGTKTATLRITHTAEGETIDIPVTAEVYMATEGDAIENPFEVTFDENGSYTYTITSLDGFYDDYIFSENEQYDANCPDVVFELTIAEGEKALVGATNANCWISRYDGFTPDNGPASKHDYPETEVLSTGTYYFVLAPNSWALPFEFTLTKTAVPAPVISYSNPSDGVVNQDNPMLVWNMDYADEYQVLLGTSEEEMEVVVDWTSELATSYQTENLQNNTQYFWQVNARNEAGTTTGEVCSFVTLLDVPAITSATAVNLYPGKATTITWKAVENVSEYNIYVDGNKVATTAETSYELSGLAYNMTGYNVTVSATHTLGESMQSEAVVVKVAGEFPLVVSVKDASDKPIEGATVTIDMTKAYDEFKNQVEAVEAMTTNAEGTATVTLPVLGGYIGESYGNGVWYPEYKIKVSKTPYTEVENSITYSNISNGTTTTQNVTLDLPTITSVSFDNEEVITVGSDIVLKWSKYGVEGATAYNVYKEPNGGDETLVETVTTNELTITAEHDNVGSKYGVSAVFGDVETSVTYTSKYIRVLGNGSFYGYVIDGTNPISGLTVELSGTNAIGNEIVTLTTDAYGYFEGEILEGNDYTLTISHYDYEEVVMSNIDIIYGENDLETIVLTAKPSAEGIAVTATDNGEYANVTWTGSYEKYNVYRRNMDNTQEVDFLGEATTSPYTDNEWAELEDGTYQYGVSTFVEEQAQSRGGEEVILNANFDDGEIPSGWTFTTVAGMSGNWYWYVNNKQAYSSWFNGGGDATIYLITPLIKTSNSTLEFDYMSAYYNGTDRSDFYVRYSTDPNGPWSDEYLYYSKYSSSGYNFDHIIVDLSIIEEKQVYIAFCHTNVNWGGNGIRLDNIVVTSESSAVESQIVWSNEITKQGPATFVGGDLEKPTAWNVAANWSNGEVPAAGADVIINANAVISSEVNVENIEVNAELTIDNGGILNVTNNFEQASYYNVVLVEGGQIFQKNEGITARFKMYIETPSDWETAKDGWQFISMPMTDVYYSDFTSLGEHDLYKYDGSKEKEWLNYKEGNDFEEGSFKSGYGYLATLKDVTTATVYGTLNVANPFTSRQFTYIVEDDKVKDLSRFHLVGNPFTYDIKWSDFNIIGNVYNFETDQVEEKQLFVNGFAIANGGGYKYHENSDATIKVGQGFFVKILENYATLSYKPNRRSSKEKSNSINVIATGKAGQDNVVINFAGQSEGFDKLQNFNEDIATVFVANNGKRYGIANVDEDLTEVELSFAASQMGNYTIGIEPNGKFQSVTLVDRMTGIETNMLMEDYNFTATANDNPNRFVIRLANGQEPTADSNFVYQSGEELIVNAEGTIQIIDVMGRMVYSNDVESSNNRINVSNLKGATYIVRNISDNTVRTQKVVIL